MLAIFGSPSRRELLTVGGLGLLGLGLGDFLRLRATAAPQPRRDGFGRAEAVILLYLQGAPSHIDLWDPKPDAPAEIRGEFKPIPTRTPGMFLGEVLPRLAGLSDKFALVRTVSVEPKGLANHGAAIYMVMTGHDPSNFTATGLAVPPTPDDLPSIGSVIARFRPASPGALGYAAICGPIREGSVTGVGMGAGILGGGCSPYQMYDDPTRPLAVETFNLPADMTLGRLQGRFDLRGTLAAPRSEGVPLQAAGRTDFDAYYGSARSLLEATRAGRAFRLDDEPAVLREKYGRSKFGQSCLLARRLIEAGTRFVQVSWPTGSDTEPTPGPDGSWDTHRNNFPMLRDHRCPVFDAAVSALLEDLDQRDLLATTLVVAVGEFGRSPKIGSPTTNNVGPGGRDHWPSCYTALLAGGGVRGGQVFGESDRYGAYPKSDPVHPYSLLATVFHAVGIDPQTQYRDKLDRPRGLTDHGKPILALF
jgi:Protein of unknown function (DUF1501)